MFKRIKLYLLHRKFRKRQAEAAQFVLLLVALIDGALVAEFLSITREYLANHPDSLFAYKVFIITITPIALIGTYIVCRSWFKPLDEIEEKLNHAKKDGKKK